MLQNDAGIDAVMETLPDRPAVFLVRMRDEHARPYLGRTARLRRRLRRLLGVSRPSARSFSLRGSASVVECHLTASALASSLTYFEFARRLFPDEYLKLTRLRPAPW